MQSKTLDPDIVTAANPEYQIGAIALPVNVTIARDDGSDVIELAHYYSSTPSESDPVVGVTGSGAGLYSGYIDQSNGVHLNKGKIKASGTVISAIYKISISVGAAGEYGGVTWSAGQIATALSSRKATVTLNTAEFTAGDAAAVTTTKYYEYASGTKTYTLASPQPAKDADASSLFKIATNASGYLRFMGSNQNKATLASADEADGTTTIACEIPLTTLTDSNTVDWYVRVYVEGGRGATPDVLKVNAPFTASVADGGPVS